MKLNNIDLKSFVITDDAVIVCSQWDNNDTIAEMKASCEEQEEDKEIDELSPNVTNKQTLSTVM